MTGSRPPEDGSRRGESQGWIRHGNLAPLLGELARLAGCAFDDGDLDAARVGLVGSDGAHEPPKWWDSALAGEHLVTLELAHDRDVGVVLVRVGAPEGLGARVGALLARLAAPEARGGG